MGETRLFTPSSVLTFDTVQEDTARLLLLLKNADVTQIRIDLSQVTHCDSAGLALLIEAKRLSSQYHKTLLIDEIPDLISGLAEFCGVENILIAYNPKSYSTESCGHDGK